MSAIEFKKKPCRPVEFKYQWPHIYTVTTFRAAVAANRIAQSELLYLTPRTNQV